MISSVLILFDIFTPSYPRLPRRGFIVRFNEQQIFMLRSGLKKLIYEICLAFAGDLRRFVYPNRAIWIADSGFFDFH